MEIVVVEVKLGNDAECFAIGAFFVAALNPEPSAHIEAFEPINVFDPSVGVLGRPKQDGQGVVFHHVGKGHLSKGKGRC